MWITPKTNWTSSDKFNPADYNRIKNNIAELRNMALQVYREFPIEDMGEDKTYEDYYFADEFNKLENNLEIINNNTFPQDLGETATFFDNQPFIDWVELNRLEQGTLKIHNILYGHIHGRRRLQFTLGKRRAV